MLKTVHIEVVKQGNQLLFKVGDTLFESLDAMDSDGGTLVVKRRGVIVAKTDSIQEHGGMDACTCFCGLTGDGSADPELYASDHPFRKGDTLILEFETKEDFDFADTVDAVCSSAD